MKTMKRKTIITWASALLITAVFASCSKETFDQDNSDPTYSTRASASGSQQVPATTTSGSGSLNGVYNARTNNWEYEISWFGLSGAATAVQVMGPASAGANGQLQVALAITINGSSGNANGSVTLTEEQQAYLLSNQLYFSVLTTANVMGEIRGQIISTQVNE